MKDKIPLIIVIIIVVVLIVLAIIFGAKKEGEEKSVLEESVLEGINIAEEIYGLSGEITLIEEKTLSVKTLIPLASEEEPVMTTIKAVVTDETEIIKLRTPEGAAEDATPEEIEMSFEELKIGDTIDIGTTENISENIKNKTEFTLSYIFIVE